MRRLHKIAQSLLKHMRVDLRCGDVGMTQQLLHGPQVRPVLQQVAGEGMAQDVRR